VYVHLKHWQILPQFLAWNINFPDEASGGSDDWAKSIGIRFTYTVELRPQGDAYTGFIVGREELMPAGKEAFSGIQQVAMALINQGWNINIIEFNGFCWEWVK